MFSNAEASVVELLGCSCHRVFPAICGYFRRFEVVDSEGRLTTFSCWRFMFTRYTHRQFRYIERVPSHHFVDTVGIDSNRFFQAEMRSMADAQVASSTPTPSPPSRSNNKHVEFEDVQTMLYGIINKLANAVPQRWVSTRGMPRTVLSSWSALELKYTENMSVAFPLAASKGSIEKLDSLVKTIAILIESTQSSGVLRAGMTLFELVAIRVSLLREGSSLCIHSPKRQVATASKV